VARETEKLFDGVVDRPGEEHGNATLRVFIRPDGTIVISLFGVDVTSGSLATLTAVYTNPGSPDTYQGLASILIGIAEDNTRPKGKK